MIRIVSVTMANFLSVGRQPQVIRLGGHALTLVLGENRDTGETNSRNGVGKTTMLHAISIGLFGEALTRIKVSNLVNNINQKGMIVCVEFERDGVVYRVERGRKPDFLRFFVDGQEEDSALGENKDTQAEITRIVGMSHALFCHIVALNTTTIPFLKMRTSDQREVIEELFGITQIAHKAEALKKLLSETKGRQREEQTSLAAMRAANDKIEQSISSARLKQARWEEDRAQRMEDIAVDIASLDGVDFDAELACFDKQDVWIERERECCRNIEQCEREITILQNEEDRILAEISKMRRDASDHGAQLIARLEAEAKRHETDAARSSDKEIGRFQADRERRTQSAQRKQSEMDRLAGDLKNLDVQLASGSTSDCATCGQPLSGTDHLAKVVSRLEAQKVELQSSIAMLDAEVKNLLVETDVIMVEIEALRKRDADARIDALAKADAALNEADAARKEQQARLEALRASMDDLEQQARVASDAVTVATDVAKDAKAYLRTLGDKPVCSYPSREHVWKARQARDTLMGELEREDALVNPNDGNIEVLTETLQPIDISLSDELQVTMVHQDFLAKLLTSPDSFIRKKVVDRNLSHLNGRLGHFLTAMHLPHDVRFKSDLDVEIALDGRDYDYEQLSRGEMNRVNLSTSWAFRDVWEALHDRMNLLFVDEVVDTGMDDSGSEDAMTVLTKMGVEQGRNVFLISHKDSMIGRADRVLMVRKEDKFTTFEEGGEPVP